MKRGRQSKVIELVETYDIETQEELAEHLRAAGFAITQATVSRDIRELQLSKISIGAGKQKYIILRTEENYLNDKYARVLKDGFISMDKAENILVIKTISGMAMAVAAAVDAMKMLEVVGCIAGDDTIMVAVRSKEETAEAMRKIQEIIHA